MTSANGRCQMRFFDSSEAERVGMKAGSAGGGKSSSTVSSGLDEGAFQTWVGADVVNVPGDLEAPRDVERIRMVKKFPGSSIKGAVERKFIGLRSTEHYGPY